MVAPTVILSGWKCHYLDQSWLYCCLYRDGEMFTAYAFNPHIFKLAIIILDSCQN